MAGIVTKMIPLAKINRPAETKMRSHLDDDHINRIAEAMESGDAIEPVDLFGPDENGVYVLSRGHHRIEAVEKRNGKSIRATIHKGDLKKAVLYAAGGDWSHGLPLTESDRRNKVVRLLSINPKMTSAEICKLTHIRKALVLVVMKAFKNAKRALAGQPPVPEKPKRQGAAAGGRPKANKAQPTRSLPPVTADTTGRDEYDQPIPAGLLDTFLGAQTAKAFSKGLAEMAKEAKEFQDTPGGAWLPKETADDLKKVADAFAENHPVAVCPPCSGTGKIEHRQCGACEGYGCLSKSQLREAPAIKRKLTGK